MTLTTGTDVSDWTVIWGQAGGGMYATIADLGTWAGSGLGTRFLPADLAQPQPEYVFDQQVQW